MKGFRVAWNGGFLATVLVVGIPMPLVGQGVEEDIRGPKALIQIPMPEPAVPWERHALIGLLVLLLVAGLIWWWKSRKPVGATAAERARKALLRLERDGGEMDAGDFAAGASQVVRVFIEKRFGLAAPKRTTEEFLQELAGEKREVLQARKDSLKAFLKSCDMAKFAGAELGEDERGALVAKARAFVEEPKEEQG